MAIVTAAAELLRTGGRHAVTTRGVAAAAGVQAPTIYRLFGDKDGLLDAVAEHAFAEHLASRASSAETDDPVADLRAGWDAHLEFGLANPAVIELLTDPSRSDSPAAAAGMDVLRRRVKRITATVLLTQMTATGRRAAGLADAAYEAVARTILTDRARAERPATLAAAVTLRADVANLAALTGAESRLLAEWLDRVIDT